MSDIDKLMGEALPKGGHNSVAGQELRQFIERWERVEAEKKDLTETQKEVMAEAKGRGYCTKTIRRVIALRKLDADARAEQEAMLEIYCSVMGI